MLLRLLEIEQIRQNIRASIAGTHEKNAQTALLRLQRPTAENIAAAANTAWGRNVKPYLGDAETIARALSIGAGAFALRNLFSGTLPKKEKPLSVDWDNLITQPPKGR